MTTQLEDVNRLIEELTTLGHRTQLLPVDDPWQLVPGVNVWAPSDPLARYPVTTVLAPLASIAPNWTWGDSFEYAAPDGIYIPVLASMVSGTCQIPRS